ncbi:MAG: hypothetical protein GIX03_13635 [Candidatus Eremiobacteraeota bacterium]|nr:hypothetical protein [Candidatus Eremiobacteraeota bacterium]MBC5804007.1 hypothetical protein [Candidatus Eremiobacteraeota bacterium]MBC5821002.1 hypothetical protein [Candidatus Eremiobacteraeota bacterium]
MRGTLPLRLSAALAAAEATLLFAGEHIDRDLDASTALRFHVGEMLLSVPYRADKSR